MSDWPRLVNLRRCARGRITDAGEATNTTISLFNSTASSELILVWQMLPDTTVQEALGISYQQIPQMANLGVVQAIVPGDAPPPGLLTSGDQPAVFTPDWAPSALSASVYCPATFPLAVLQPAWSLVFQPIGGGTGALGVDLFWEAILPKYFDRFYTHQLLEIQLALKG